jgi:hypothetical protein
VDHKGQCTVWVVKPDGSEIFVTLKVQGSRSPSPALDEAVTDNVGVGISISAANGVPVVAALSPWGSARWSGKIAIGDEVVSVHGVPCSRLAPQQVIGLIEDCSENDGGLVKMAIRRKGPLSHSEPLLVLLAREKKSKADGQSSQYPPQETGSRDLMDIKARPAPMHTSPIEHGQFLQDQGANRETTLPHAVAKLSDQSLNTPSNILVSQNGRQLGPALHQLLSYLKAPDGSEVHPLGAFDEAASSEDMKILHLVKDEAVEQKTKLKNALELVELSKENMEKRKQHIITLSAQLKQAEEKRHRDLKSNNEWMRLEMQKQNESVEAEKARLQADMQEQTRKLEDQLNEKYSQQLKQVELSVEEIQREADTKEKYLKDLNRQQQHLEDENASLRAENLAFKDRVAQLVRQLGERQREPAGERPDIVRLERENAELRSQFEHERAELKSELQAALMATRGVTTDSAGEAAQMKEKERKIEALDAVNKELQTQLAEKNEHCDRIEKMLSELEGKFKATESLAEVKMPVIEQQRQVPQVQRARPPSESPVEIEEPFIDVPLCAPSSDQESPPEEITTVRYLRTAVDRARFCKIALCSMICNVF